ncbi:MAG: hypothetical protein ABI397_01190 [Candidatus Saccharimonas sp.]
MFYFRNQKIIREVKPHFNQFAERFFTSKESNVLIVVWAAAEAFIWFVLPEFLLFLIIFLKVRKKFDLLKYDLIGTAIGTTIAILWHAPASFLITLPYVYQGMIEKVQGWFTDWGIWGLFFQPFSGVPFKVFNHTAYDFGFFIPFFIIIAVIARMIRYFVAYEITKAIYPFIHKFVQKNYAILFAVAVLVFTMLLMRISQIYN